MVQTLFPKDYLASRGFEFKGFCYGNNQAPYYETSIDSGYIAIVGFKTVLHVDRQDNEDVLAKIKTPEDLEEYLKWV